MTATANEKTRTNVYLDTAMEKGIPFQIKIPNDETAQVIKEARVGKNMTKISLDELKKEVGA